MAWRQLPDGSWLNTETGDLNGFNEEREAFGRAMAIKAGRRAPGLAGGGFPTPPLPQQKFVALPAVGGPKAILDPKRNLLAVNPYELGMGSVSEMSDTKKRFLLCGLIVAAAAGYVWLSSRKAK
jgi:hypothetical protein